MGQLTYMPTATEIAVLFRWTSILQHCSCSQEKSGWVDTKTRQTTEFAIFFPVVMFLLNNRQVRGSPGSTPWQLCAGLAIASFKWCCNMQLKQRTAGNCFPIGLMVMWDQRRNCNATLVL